MPQHANKAVDNLSDLLAYEAAVDISICGIALDEQLETRLANQGAHDPTPTPYFVLEELFGHFSFGPDSHLLDVGCGTGRVLAYFASQGYSGRATGIELDPALADQTWQWSRRHAGIRVLQGDALAIDLSPYTDFYLFNPFDPNILQQFIQAIECQVSHPCTVVHMSDNGDTWRYVGRDGWTQLATGSFQDYRNSRGYPIRVYDHPQHYTVWHYDGNGLA